MSLPAPIHHEDKDEDEKDDAPPKSLRIDFEGITGRILGFPVEEGEYGELAAAKGRLLFTRFAVKGIKPEGSWWEEEPELGELQAYDFAQQRMGTLATEVAEMRLGDDHRTLVYLSRERMRVIDAGRELPDHDGDDEKDAPEANRRTGWLDLARASVEIVPPDEWSQMYFEAWRLQSEQFWDEGMSDVDWVRVRERYARLLPQPRTRGDLSDLIWEMYGELGTSHAYEMGGDLRVPPRYRHGFLGADIVYDESAGGYRIVTILRGDSWDRSLDSPLADPGVDVRAGDVILDVGGKPVSRTLSPDALLINLAGREDESAHRPRRRASSCPRKDLTQRPAATLPGLGRAEPRLRSRANRRRGRVLTHSGHGAGGILGISSRLSYRVRSRSAHRRCALQSRRSRLSVAARKLRPQARGLRRVALLAAGAVSTGIGGRPDGRADEPVCRLRRRHLQPLLQAVRPRPAGRQTHVGGVIGINPYHRLVDGTVTTQPEFSFWFTDVGWAVENYGTDPDYDVDIAPHDVKAGRDPQMEKALELIATARLSAVPLPRFDNRPKLTLPT